MSLDVLGKLSELSPFQQIFGHSHKRVPLGMEVIFSPSILSLVQTRFPKSKKRRTRAKWAKRNENFELQPAMYQMDGRIYAHPRMKPVFDAVTEAIPKVSPVLGAMMGMLGSLMPMPPMDRLAEVSVEEFEQRLEAQTLKSMLGLG